MLYVPFGGTSSMSKDSKSLRDRAARELKRSRNGSSHAEKTKSVKRAAAYKSLAENEQWLEGENPRSPRRD
jgi:hypothetical protein